MEKIVVIGSPGAGKSTFARALGKNLNIEVLHLDRYFWQPGWKRYSREERITIQQVLMHRKTRWIIEGSYISSSDGRLSAADTIIFLDMPRLACLWRVIKRHITTHNQASRPDLPDGCTDKLSMLSIAKILLFPYSGRTLLRAKLNQRGKNQELCILRSHRDIEHFLSAQSNKRLREYMHVEPNFTQEGGNCILALCNTVLNAMILPAEESAGQSSNK